MLNILAVPFYNNKDITSFPWLNNIVAIDASINRMSPEDLHILVVKCVKKKIFCG